MIALLAMALIAGEAPPSGDAAPGAPLSEEDLAAARVAWAYFERNYQPATGMVSSIDGYPSTTMWDLGSSVLATIAGRELDLVDAGAFELRMRTLVRTLATLPLFDGALPNKAYDAATGAMTDYQNHPVARGIGVSALDVARLVSALLVLARLHPEHAPAVAQALRRWDVCRLAEGGELHGLLVDGSGKVKAAQEGRLGYEQYAAHALAALGLDVGQARRYDRFAAETDILGLAVPHDTRDPAHFGAVDALVTEPWVLDAFEFGLGEASRPLAARIFEVQKRRWERTGVVTAASEDHVDQPPWFVYGAIWAGGVAWRTVTAEGAEAAALRGLSTKAAFALATLFPDDPYAAVLRQTIAWTSDPVRGWYAGLYDRGGVNRSVNANTNGVVLEALLFRAVGPLLRAPAPAVEATGGEGDLARLAAGCLTAPAHAVSNTPVAGGGSGTIPARLAPVSPPHRPPADLGFRVDGTFFSGYRGIDGPIAGGVATVWPWKFAFLRIGGEATPYSKGDHGPTRLLWGIGYDDWHENTFFLHADNWGQLSAQQGLGARGAEVNAGYRLPRLCLASWLCAAPLVAMTGPFSGGPYLSARVNLTFWRDWFVMGGLGWTVPGVLPGPVGTPTWRVVYGVGRSSWKPGSLFITYYDWGPSYRDHNGVLAVGVHWGF
ncbi:MAG TPA: DUF3131 domain-containing protein [Anaeromyxobacteraceae bacterium]|nr:DUF3131 domain-containing protein [Anaeromyxobacteraceae bacterium]